MQIQLMDMFVRANFTLKVFHCSSCAHFFTILRKVPFLCSTVFFFAAAPKLSQFSSSKQTTSKESRVKFNKFASP